MSNREARREFLHRHIDPERSRENRQVVRKIMGLEPLYPPLPDTMSPLEKIKLYARAGFVHRADGSEEDFEQLWLSAIPVKRSKFADLAEALAERKRERGEDK